MAKKKVKEGTTSYHHRKIRWLSRVRAILTRRLSNILCKSQTAKDVFSRLSNNTNQTETEAKIRQVREQLPLRQVSRSYALTRVISTKSFSLNMDLQNTNDLKSRLMEQPSLPSNATKRTNSSSINACIHSLLQEVSIKLWCVAFLRFCQRTSFTWAWTCLFRSISGTSARVVARRHLLWLSLPGLRA